MQNACGQGFFLSFGLDVPEYRSFMLSIVALLRMAVGDFDYVQLENSHSVVGPAMFWVYIFLMFSAAMDGAVIFMRPCRFP